jgi:hypothetical protein
MPNKNQAIVAKATKNLKNKLRLTAIRNNSFFRGCTIDQYYIFFKF